ncbi:MAG: mechanosensitive ion channel family protein [Mesorhizobium sp.]
MDWLTHEVHDPVRQLSDLIAKYVIRPLMVAVILALGVSALGAQGPDRPPVPEIVETQQKVIHELEAAADRLERQLESAADDDGKMLGIRTDLEGLARRILEAGVAFRPRLNEINTRLELLGPAPANGQPPESDLVANERNALTSEKNQINVLIGEAETLSVRVSRLINKISDLRRELFANALWKRYDVNLTLLGDMMTDLRTETRQLVRTVSSWGQFALKYKLPSVLGATFFAIMGALLLLIGGRRVIGGLIYKDPADPDPPYISRLSVVFWSTLLRTGSVCVFLFATWFFFDYFEVLRGDIGRMLSALFAVIALVYFVHRLTRAALSPNLPAWRLIDIEPGPARGLIALATITATLTGIDYLLSKIFEVMGSRLSVTVGESLIATLLVGLLIVLCARIKPFVDAEGRPRAWPVWLRLTLYILGGATMVAALLGYIGFAKFVSQQVVVTGAILALAYIGVLSASAVSEVGAFAGTALGRGIGKRFNLSEAGFDQLGLVTGILINCLVFLIALPIILLQWGFQWGDIRTLAYSIATEIKVGSVSFSLIGIMTGVGLFILGYFATRWFQGWLDNSVMARGRVDTGVRNSIRTAIGYAGVALAGLIGISAAGIDLSNLALVAGALSLGIGFGLQNVVSNFVSGLILLAERPFKVGDWVVAGAVSGTVRKISVRATEIETFQRQTVIMPNSELINSAVGNWTHKNKLGRIEVKVNVAYGADARRAHQIMLDIARNHPLVLRNPEPFVLFANFANTAMEFEIRMFLADINNGSTVQNDIRFAILEAFEASEIEIPSAPRMVDTDMHPLTAQAENADEVGVAPPRRRNKKDTE